MISAYCWSGAADRMLLRDKANTLMLAVRMEIAARRGELVVLSVDLNGDDQYVESIS